MEFEAINNFGTLIHSKVESWLEMIIKHLPNFVVALFIILLFMFMSRIVGRLASNLFNRIFESQQIASLLSAIVRIVTLIVGFFIALEFLGLTGTVTSLLAGAGIIGLAIGFAFQDMTENFIAGIAMGIRKPFQIGDVIEAQGVFGTVITINLRNTLIETFYGQLEIVPNKILFRNIVTNYSSKGERKVEVKVGISYADDIEKAKKVLESALKQKDYVSRKDEVNIFAEGFGESSINLLVWFWIDYPGEPGFMQARSDAVHLVHKTLDKHEILIPFPIRTLDFGAKGGEKLGTQLKHLTS